MSDTTDPTRGRLKTSRIELINEINRLADTLDKTPTFADMTEHGKYSGVLYVNRFGSWNDAVEEPDSHQTSEPRNNTPTKNSSTSSASSPTLSTLTHRAARK